jgi:DNA-binding NtrC family response regulator
MASGAPQATCFGCGTIASSMGEDAKPAAATRVIEQPGGATVLMVRRSTLAVVRGPDRGQAVTIEGRPARVGTDRRCDLVLQDPSVSAVHFVVEPGGAGFLLRDLGSTNGTIVDGYRVEGIYLPRSAQIDAGQTRLRFTTLKEELEIPLSKRTRFGDLLGHSDAMRQVFAILERVSDSDCTVLLEGESGTGKELAARALHEASSRRGELFVAVDCGALPPSLIESELFGHVKGAFTGAAGDRPGLFEEADGGTLFLDEIGELPLDLQPKLLRVLESRCVRRLGDARAREVNVRLVAATNRNLTREVAEKRFREDLYFRLGVIRVRLPTLRERREEIPRLVAHFMSSLGQDPSQGIPDSMMAMLQEYPWPGNVRELRNVVERLVLLPGMQPDFYLDGAAAARDPDGNGLPIDLAHGFHEGKRLWTERFEREYLARQLRNCKGNVSELARVSGLSRQSCHRLLGRYGLGSAATRDPDDGEPRP